MSDDQAREMRPETTSEHIARDMREGRFPEQSERQMVPVLASLPHEIQVWRSMDALDHTGTWSTTRYPAEAVTYVSKADAQAAVVLVVERAAAIVSAVEEELRERGDYSDQLNEYTDAANGARAAQIAIRALAPADGLAAVEALRAEQTSSPNPYDDCAHFDDHAVNRFAVAMKGKLAAKRLQGRGGWQEVENGYLSRLLREHVDKGDPVDVANLAMMIHQRGERIGPENEGATCGAIERAEAERDRLAAELAAAKQREAGLLAALQDPLVVHLNMEAGKIAKPLPSQLVHIYGEDTIRAALASTPPDDTWHERRTMLPDGDARKEGGK